MMFTVGPDALATRCPGEMEAIGEGGRIRIIGRGVESPPMFLREAEALAYELLALVASGARTYKP